MRSRIWQWLTTPSLSIVDATLIFILVVALGNLTSLGVAWWLADLVILGAYCLIGFLRGVARGLIQRRRPAAGENVRRGLVSMGVPPPVPSTRSAGEPPADYED